MTLQACQFFVFAGERPVGFLAVIEASLFPVAGVVATRALVPVPTPVDIAAAMAGDAFGRRATVAYATGMTGLTGAVTVRPGEFEIGFCAVVKGRGGPVFLVMAAPAVLPVTAQVHIPQLVTAAAVGVVETVLLAGVATAALQRFMLTLKWKIGAAVVELPGFLPAIRGMAIGALLPQRCAVLILFLVTVITGSGGFPEAGAGDMATLARGPRVFSQQGKIGVLMIKDILVHGHDVVLQPLVIGMAALATDCAGHRGATVKARALIAIRSNVFVAIQAQGILGGFVKTAVADLTVFLLFGMGPGEGTGHQDH